MLIWCMILHFIADFLLQSREMGKKKSSEPFWLAFHLWIQFNVFTAGLVFLTDPKTAIMFSLANAAIHGVIDWNIWRLYKLSAHLRIKKKSEQFNRSPEVAAAHYEMGVKNWKYWEDHWFYATIGLDQLLHAATIIALAGAML